MFSVGLLVLLAASAGVETAILEDLGGADLQVVRIRLEEEKAKQLLLQNDVEVLMLQVEDLKRKCGQRVQQVVHENVSLVTHGVFLLSNRIDGWTSPARSFNYYERQGGDWKGLFRRRNRVSDDCNCDGQGSGGLCHGKTWLFRNCQR